MRINSDDKTRHIALELIEAEQTLLSGKVRVFVDFGGFTARATVWLERDEIDGWMRALESLDKARTGRARLESMSPGELILTVSAMDVAGHLLLECALLQRVYVRNRWIELRMQGAFELDPTCLPDVVVGLRAISAGIVRGS
jgi:hypothetical protein